MSNPIQQMATQIFAAEKINKEQSRFYPFDQNDLKQLRLRQLISRPKFSRKYHRHATAQSKCSKANLTPKG